MKRTMTCLALVGSLSLAAGCAQQVDPNAKVTSVRSGEIAASEAVQATSNTGQNAAISIGSAVIGALIPGPWGGVAGVTTGVAGRAALDGQTGTVRYVVRMADGSFQTVEQPTDRMLPSGTRVDVIAMSDGSRRVVARTGAGTSDQPQVPTSS